LLTAGVTLLGAFFLIERRASHPMLDISLFHSRLFSTATVSALANYICLYSVTFLLPFYLIQGRGMGTMEAGQILTAQPLIMAIAAPISGTLSDRIGSRLPGTLGMAILALGLFWLSQLGAPSPTINIVLALVVTGLGTGIFISPNTSALMGSAPRHRQGIASGILATARNVGMVLGVGLAGAIFTTVLAQGQAAGSATAMFDGISASFRVASGIALLGALISATRGE
jgi:MFS family permease